MPNNAWARNGIACGIVLGLVALAGCTPPPPEPVKVAAETTPARRPNAPQRVAQILNMSSVDLTALFGSPVLRRNENGGEVWLYAHPNGCSLDVVLFPSGKQLSVAHATTKTPVKMSEADCLQAIANNMP